MKRINNFTEGKIVSPLIRFALPVLGALFLQSMYGAVDMLIVGRFSTPAEISAVSTGSWILQCIAHGIVGISMGTTILLGMRIGEGRSEEAGDTVGSSILMFAILGVAMTALVEIFAVPIARLMRAPEEAFASTVKYIRICAAGSVFIIGYNLIGSIFRGLGDSKMPLITVTIACVFNILGDLLLVGVFRMAAAGAAIATVAAQILSVVLSLFVIRRRGLPFSFGKKNLRFRRDIIGRVLKLGFPIAFQSMLVSFSFLTITAIVNSLGLIPSAGVGVAEKICGFIMLIPDAFSQSMSAFVAQNMGAKKPERAKKALFYSIGISLGVGLLVAYISFFHGDFVAGIFNKDAQVIAAAAEYLKAYAIDCLLVSFMFCMTGYFNGQGRTTFVMAQGITGAFLIRIPVAFAMSRRVPVSLFLVGLSTPCSTVVQILLCTAYFIWTDRKDRNALRTV